MEDVPNHLLERDDVVSEAPTERLDATAFERARQRDAEIVGAVVVAVTNAAGEVLLVENDWMDGFGFPGGGVEPGEDWRSAAAREVVEETGVAVQIDHPWRVQQQTLEHAEDGSADPSSSIADRRAAPQPSPEILELAPRRFRRWAGSIRSPSEPCART